MAKKDERKPIAKAEEAEVTQAPKAEEPVKAPEAPKVTEAPKAEEPVKAPEAPKVTEAPKAVEAVEAVGPAPRMVKVRPTMTEPRCCIGGKWYSFQVGKEVMVPENVAKVLREKKLAK